MCARPEAHRLPAQKHPALGGFEESEPGEMRPDPLELLVARIAGRAVDVVQRVLKWGPGRENFSGRTNKCNQQTARRHFERCWGKEGA